MRAQGGHVRAVRLLRRDGDAGGVLEIALVGDAPGAPVDRLRIDYAIGANHGQAELWLGAAVPVPDILVDDPKAESQVLRSSPEVAADLEAQFRKERDALRLELSQPRQLQVADARRFFGMLGDGLANFSATLIVRPEQLFDPGDAPAEPLLEAEARGAIRLQVAAFGGAAAVDAEVRLSVVIPRHAMNLALDEAIQALLAVEGPALKGLNLRWPQLRLPRLTFDGISLNDLSLSSLDLPLPQAHAGFVWDAGGEPRLAVALDDGRLTVTTTHQGNGQLGRGETPADRSDPANALLTVRGLSLSIADAAPPQLGGQFQPMIPATALQLKAPIEAGPFLLRFEDVTFSPKVEFDLANGLHASAELIAERLVIVAREDPQIRIAIAATYVWTRASDGAVTGSLTRLKLLEPHPLALIAQGLPALLDAFRISAALDLDVQGAAEALERLAQLLGAAVRWMARKAAVAAGAVGRALAGLAESAAEALESILAWLREHAHATGVSGVLVELRLDPQNFQLQHLILTPAQSVPPPAGEFSHASEMLELKLSAATRPSLVVDFRAEGLCALVVGLAPGSSASISTDLWLARRSGGTDAVREDKDGERPPERLITATCSVPAGAPPVDVALLAIEGGRARFLRKFIDDGHKQRVPLPSGAVAVAFGGEPRLVDLKVGDDSTDDIKAEVTFAADLQDRVLPFLKGSASSGAGSAFSQRIKIESAGAVTVAAGEARLPLGVVIEIADQKLKTELLLSLELSSLRVRLASSEQIGIRGGPIDETLLGMNLRVRAGKDKDPADFERFVLDFSDGDARLALSEEAVAELAYDKVASSGRGLVFKVDTFAASRDGLDLSAAILPDPVQLSGVGTAFRFKSGGLSIRKGRLVGATLEGVGQLPPDLVGEATAEVAISLAARDNQLIVQSAKGFLKPGAPLVCEGTRFRFQIDELGFTFIERDSHYRFLFLLTGEARFKPGDGEFTSGLLANLAKTKVILRRAPLGGGRELLGAIEFQTPIDPPVSAMLFDIFRFSIKSVGFHPASPAFGGDPALSIGGQMAFLSSGDVPNLKIDFHELMFAGPEPGGSTPRVRLGGLGVEVKIGGVGKVAATAIAVDPDTPALNTGVKLDKGVTARGFLASGHLDITGFATLTASAGFLELRKTNEDGTESPPKHSMFAYGQLQKLAIPVNIMGYDIYLEEAGFGGGQNYTHEALAEIDKVSTPPEMIKALEPVVGRGGNLSDFRVWRPEYEGSRFTVVMRVMLAFSAASAGGSWDEDSEKKHPSNPVLFDLTLAIRSDLTFLMIGRAWLCVTYYDWIEPDQSGLPDGWKERPSLIGYMYLSIPRQMMLARLVADPKGVVGNKPPLFEPLKKALTSVKWSSTLLVTPGLFHQEFGWPYELEYTIEGDADRFRMTIQGGLVFRIEDGAMLYGAALRAKGYAQFRGDFGGRNFGASAHARADFSLDAKFIAYISVRERSKTLFYGVLRLDVSIEFSVRVWLVIPLPFDNEIKLEAGFSASLSISFAVELAAQPANPYLGGRANASLQVSALGRTLSIGVGFDFNKDFLADARERAARFLELGLTVSPPDPAKGLAASPPPPRPEASRAQRVAVSDNAVEKEADAVAAVTQYDGYDPHASQRPGGVAIGRTDWWALLFPTHDDQGAETFVVQLLPRDLQQAFAGDGQPDAEGPARNATYLAPPPPESVAARDWDHCIVGRGGAALTLHRLTSTGEVETLAGAALKTRVSWDASIAEGGGQTATLRQLHEHCFFGPLVVGGTVELFSEPPQGLTQHRAKDERLPEDPDAAGAELAHVARMRAAATGQTRFAYEVEERRSGVIAALGETAARIAAAGSAGGKWLSRIGGIDARDFGLTFVATRAELDALFDLTGDHTTPPVARFTVASCQSVKTGVDQNGVDQFDHRSSAAGAVLLFNPPSRFFEKARLELVEAAASHGPQGVMLTWDLEKQWEGSVGPYDDPEFHLKHYIVQRRIPSLDVTTDPLTVKPANHAYQHLDDLRDLAPELRSALLSLPDHDLPVEGRRAAEKTLDRLRQLAGSSTQRPTLEVQYTIIPVDFAGTRGARLTLAAELPLPEPKPLRISAARLEVRYPDLPRAGGAAVRPLLKLQINWPESDKPPLSLGRLELRVRAERTVAAGLYGADALMDAAGRPALESLDEMRPDDELFTIELGTPGPGDDLVRAGWLGDPGLKDYRARPAKTGGRSFRAALGLLSDVTVEGVRCHARRIGLTGRPGPWQPADVVLAIAHPKADTAAQPLETRDLAVEAPVEVFEHPMRADFAALDFEDLAAEAGRLHQVTPRADATLAQLLAAPRDATKMIIDPGRRTGVRLRWSTAGSTLALMGGAPTAKPLASLIGGFDLFGVHPDGLPPPPDRDSATVQAHLETHAQHLGRVQLLPESLAAHVPSVIGVLNKVEASFPSEARLRAAPGEAAPPWYSTAESLLAWPKIVLRRCLVPVPDETDVIKLFAKGRPTEVQASLVVPSPWQLGVRTPLTPPPNDGEALSVNEVRAWMRALRWTRADGGSEADVDKAFAEDPAAWKRSAVLRLVAKRGATETAAIEIPLTIGEGLHAVLADVLDELRYCQPEDGSPDLSGGRLYRRLEPVLEPTAPVSARTLHDFMDETTEAADPHGFGALRGLGLAAALRLYDTEAGAFLEGHEVLRIVSQAFTEVLGWYGGAEQLGAPFADVFARHEGLARLGSFDAGPPEADLADQWLSFVQIALRPIAEPVQNEGARRFVRYVRLKRASLTDAAEIKVTDIPRPKDRWPAIIDIELLGGGARGKTLTVASQSLPNLGDTRVAELLDGADGEARFKENDLVAIARVVAAHEDDISVHFTGFVVEKVPTPAAAGDAAPYRRFAPLDAPRLNALYFRASRDAGEADVYLEPRAAELHRDLLRLAARFGEADRAWAAPGGYPAEGSDAAREVLQRLEPWSQRFVRFGAARKPEAQAVSVSLCRVPRPEPWRVVAREDGAADLLLLRRTAGARAAAMRSAPMAGTRHSSRRSSARRLAMRARSFQPRRWKAL